MYINSTYLVELILKKIQSIKNQQDKFSTG
ncbi:hypothetical protein SAMN06297358_0116 [Pedobacter xixiisoli]|uniref:Uncharacterized protein n=1 Tax=Pedobacter xixiisoli TaxID=1476464 RepID=A0A285ZP00_9SPHI|nr:hypothetical protein SAMN06297358_0116 [Pedobacter xixiisoli]